MLLEHYRGGHYYEKEGHPQQEGVGSHYFLTALGVKSNSPRSR